MIFYECIRIDCRHRKNRSRLSECSDFENMEVMLRDYAKHEFVDPQRDRETDVDLRSDELQQNGNHIGEDFRSILNSNSTESSKITVETVRMIKVRSLTSELNTRDHYRRECSLCSQDRE